MKITILPTCISLFLLVITTGALGADSPRIVTGEVIANRSVTLATRIVGRITQVHVSESDEVARDMTMVEIDDTEYRAKLRSSEADEERAKAELDHRQRVKDRLEQLTQNNAISQDAIDEAIYGLDVAKANLKKAQAQREAIRSTLAETRIKAPFDAVVISKFAEIGMVTQPGQALYEIQDQSKLKFRARVKEDDLKHIQLGDQAMITISAHSEEPIGASVIRIIPSGDDRHTFTIELGLPDHSGLYPGMFGKAVFE
jgi:RND family efflux transporter MFP subunit